MSLTKWDTNNFETLRKAFATGDAALMEVQRVSDGKVVAVITAVSWDGKKYSFTPFATMVEGNPFELFRPPAVDGGFHPTEAEEAT
jgi:hypothetical protein